MFNQEAPKHLTAWPNAPTHKLSQSGTYFVTCGTYNKIHHFAGSHRLAVLHRGLLLLAHRYGWQLEAWAVFSNHYHFVAHSPAPSPDAGSLTQMLSHLHTQTAAWINKQAKQPGRKVWHNYWDTRLTYPGAYFARLNYTHNNPVKHGLVTDARLYPWCSANWLERTATPAQVKTLLRFKIDHVNVPDNFSPSPEW